MAMSSGLEFVHRFHLSKLLAFSKSILPILNIYLRCESAESWELIVKGELTSSHDEIIIFNVMWLGYRIMELK